MKKLTAAAEIRVGTPLVNYHQAPKMESPFCGYAAHVEVYNVLIQSLCTEREKITLRGRLTADEDPRLYEIDARLEELEKCLEKAWEELECDSE